MPKNKGKGGKTRRRGKNEGDQKRELILKEDGQSYAQVLKMLGNEWIEAYGFDGITRRVHIRGAARKKAWVNVGDIILISLRNFQDQKADLILKYSADEVRTLHTMGQIPNHVNISSLDHGNKDASALDEECVFDFNDI